MMVVEYTWAQPDDHNKPSPAWAGRRIVMLTSFGDYFTSGNGGRTEVVKANGLGVNIVAIAHRVEGDRIWINANGAVEPVGWIVAGNAILLEDAVGYFTSLIGHNPKDWDAYLRRAEAEHALNQREAAIRDYSQAIELRPDEPFLFLRRGRSWRANKSCPQAVADFEAAARLRPQWAELYSMQAGVYSDCPDPAFRDQSKAISLIQRAIALDDRTPTYLTVLALAYSRSGRLDEAVRAQKQALDSPSFPPGYREEATRQLHEYENALAIQKR
jgi:tetratricopeptide (TPR) repeat protein